MRGNSTFQGVHCFKAKINIEVQWASEPVIAAIERNGGVITTAYYDMHCIQTMCNTEQFFSRGSVLVRLSVNMLIDLCSN